VLAQRFLDEAATAAGRPAPVIDPGLLASLAAYEWPGNVRELRNVLERAVALGGAELAFAADALGLPGDARPTDSAPAIDPAIPFHQAKGRLVDTWEREYLTALLASCQGNISLAARRGDFDRAYLYRLLKKRRLSTGALGASAPTETPGELRGARVRCSERPWLRMVTVIRARLQAQASVAAAGPRTTSPTRRSSVSRSHRSARPDSREKR